MTAQSEFAVACPLPRDGSSHIMLAHGGGGTLMHALIDTVFASAFQGSGPERHDGAVVEVGGQRLAFTTDSYVVHPLIFPGGDIGTLAVNGTVNDLAMCGARPRWLSAGFILEEGLSMDTLRQVVASMDQAARAAGVQLVAGDTKVVDRGKGDGLFINTAGIGVLDREVTIGPTRVRPGDRVVVSGDLGRHGIAIISQREGLTFESAIRSDCAPLADVVLALLAAGIDVHCLRDLTRGGLTSALNEIATGARLAIDVDERAIPVGETVRGACELLGLDALSVANEGRFVAFVPVSDLPRTLAVMRACPVSAGAVPIGRVSAGPAGLVTLLSQIGARRILDMPSGEQLPRIC
jgi:hydrogenase expression/formation protein HypE